MKILLLGATGLLGHNVLERLIASDHHVVVLVRRPDAIRLPQGGWQTIVGSPLDYETLCRAAAGCDAVINCTGTTDMSLRRLDDYLPVNRDLPAMLVRLMEEQGIGILVHTSTANTIGYGTATHPADESTPMQQPFQDSFYAQSKILGEQVVIDAAQRHPDWHAVVLNPGFMLGPYDVKPSSGRMLLAAYRRPLMFAPCGGKAFVSVQDVAEAAVNALTLGANGGRYLVTNNSGCITIRELYRLQADLCDYRQRVLTLPTWLMSLAGRVGDLLRAVGIRTELSTCNIRQLRVCEYYDNSLGRSALHYSETPIAQAVSDFHQWRNKTDKI